MAKYGKIHLRYCKVKEQERLVLMCLRQGGKVEFRKAAFVFHNFHS